MEKAAEKRKGREDAVEEFVEIALHFGDLKEERCSFVCRLAACCFLHD